jgi:hypothetical protein
VVLVSSISNFFTDKTYLANKWMSFSSSNLALTAFLYIWKSRAQNGKSNSTPRILTLTKRPKEDLSIGIQATKDQVQATFSYGAKPC